MTKQHSAPIAKKIQHPAWIAKEIQEIQDEDMATWDPADPEDTEAKEEPAAPPRVLLPMEDALDSLRTSTSPALRGGHPRTPALRTRRTGRS